jgi:hypothetical protein
MTVAQVGIGVESFIDGCKEIDAHDTEIAPGNLNASILGSAF